MLVAGDVTGRMGWGEIGGTGACIGGYTERALRMARDIVNTDVGLSRRRYCRGRALALSLRAATDGDGFLGRGVGMVVALLRTCVSWLFGVVLQGDECGSAEMYSCS